MENNKVFFMKKPSYSIDNYINYYNFINNNTHEKSYENEGFLNFIYQYENILKKTFKKYPMVIYYFIDKYYNNIYQPILENSFLNSDSIEKIKYIWDNNRREFDGLQITNRHKKIYEIINSEQNEIEYYLINKLWLKSNKYYILDENINIIGKQLILLYYHEMFKIKDMQNIIINDDDNYNYYLQLLTSFFHVLKIENNSIIPGEDDYYFKPIDTTEDTLTSDDDKKSLLLSFFKYIIEKKIINKNVITWFYIIYKEHIFKNQELILSFTSIVFDIDKNICNSVLKLLKFINKEYHLLDLSNLNLIIEKIKVEPNYFANQIDQNLSLEDYKMDNYSINNLSAFRQINQERAKDYDIINFDINLLSIENFFFIYLTNPLNKSFKFILEEINLKRKTYNMLEKYCYNELPKYYNSCIVEFNNGENKPFYTNYNSFKEDYNDYTNAVIHFNIPMLLLNLISVLYNYNLVLDNKLTLNENIENTKIDINKIIENYLSIYPNDKYKIKEYIKINYGEFFL